MGNLFTQSTGAIAKIYSHDSRGNIVSDGTRTFVYNQNNRLVRVEEGAIVLGEYFYDAFGRRVKKVASGVTTVYHYDIAGNLIAETQADGTPLRDIVYLNGERVGMRLYGTLAGWYFFVNDHLGTPQKIINSSGQIVWAGFYLPFGKAWAYPATINNNFRFPGQYYDAENGLHYNWHRYYDPDTGRYITADPIGLEGGVNLYAYVRGNPANLIDPTGEMPPLDFIWDALNIVYDIITDDKASLAADIAAFYIPYFPAGVTKVCKIGKASKIDPNKLAHIFDQAKHGLQPLVNQFGSKEAAFQAMQNATEAVVKSAGIKGVFETTVKVGTETITVRGNVINGVTKIGTAFK